MSFVIASILCLGLADGPPPGAADRHVVVISIDGFPAYLLDDPHSSLPNLRRLRETGSWAEGGMVVSNPAVTWPNHTSLMTGLHPEHHGVLYNGRPERKEPGLPTVVVASRTQAELVRVPLLFDVLKKAGFTSAAINWPCTRGSTTIDDNFPDVPDQLRFSTPRLVKMLDDRGLTTRFEKGSGPVRDEVWTEATVHVLKYQKPNFLALHLLNLDAVHHRYAPKSPAGYTAAALADARVGQVLEALDAAGLREKTTVFVLADHGFNAVKKAVRPNVRLRAEGLLTVDNTGNLTAARAHVIPEGGTGMLYLTDPETAEQDRQAVRRIFEKAEGIERILEPADYPAYHLPVPGEHPGMADMVLVAKDGYTISGVATGDEYVTVVDPPTGSHGFVSTDKRMNAVFIASGAGVRSGVKLDTVNNVDLAPTVAWLLGGIRLEPTTGRVLGEILTEAP